MSQRFEKVFLVLDALDECTPDQRRELFEVLGGLVSPTHSNSGNVKLFVTSREEPDIKREFQNFPVIPIEAKKVDEDLESYVTAKIDQYIEDGNLRIEAALKNKIRTTLVDRAGGM